MVNNHKIVKYSNSLEEPSTVLPCKVNGKKPKYCIKLRNFSKQCKRTPMKCANHIIFKQFRLLFVLILNFSHSEAF